MDTHARSAEKQTAPKVAGKRTRDPQRVKSTLLSDYGKTTGTPSTGKTAALLQADVKTWPLAEMIGYTPITTFWNDFTIAEPFGENAVRDTFNRAFDEWKGNYKYLTELVMVLNHKIWQHDGYPIADVYTQLWAKADDYGMYNLEGEELQYFLNVLN